MHNIPLMSKILTNIMIHWYAYMCLKGLVYFGRSQQHDCMNPESLRSFEVIYSTRITFDFDLFLYIKWRARPPAAGIPN